MGTTQNIESLTCYHCGENCENEVLDLDEKNFCCEGCRTVYGILNDHNLSTYYTLDANPGQTIKANSVERKRFEYLTDPDVQKKLIDFKRSTTSSVTFFIPGIHCTSCVWLLENLQKIDAGVIRGTVNFLKRTVNIIFDHTQTDLRSIVELLTTIGYEPNLKLEQLGDKKTTGIQRSLWLKLGVAGFCFGNIMLFSFPEYLKMDQSGSSDMFRYFFSALNIMLALPVLLYSSIDYLRSAWAALSQKGINLDVPISIGIIALFGRSMYEILSGTGAGYLDSFTGFIFFLLIGKMVQKKTFDRLSFDRDYKSYLPISVIRVSEAGSEESIPVNKLNIGDHIIIRNQELVPSDSLLQSGEVEVDYSFITGEAEPVTVLKGDLIYAGGRVIGGHADMLVSRKVEHSYLTQLWENEAFKSSSRENRLTSFADRISPHFTVSVLSIALISLIVWWQIEPTKAFTIFTAVLIIACPCALALSTPFTLGATVNILSLNGLYVKSTDVVEELSKGNAFVFDKTGTLTESEKNLVQFKGIPLSEYELRIVASITRKSIHPISKNVFQSIEIRNLLDSEDFYEVPGKGAFAKFGATTICIGNRSFILEQTDIAEQDIPPVQHPGSVVHIAIDRIYKGHFELENKVREGLTELLNSIDEGNEAYLLSGDNEQDAGKLSRLFPNWKVMLFNQSPVQKLEFIEELKSEGKHVVMIGDGLNDAGALSASNFGIAISDDMSAFSPACDAIAESSSLHKLNELVHFTRVAFRVIIASFMISLLYNLTGLGFAITGNLSPLVAAILMPLSSVSIMAFTNIVTRVKAKQMGLRIWV